ncbi:hypothetical protein HK102_004359 [Quaeritorhiza haematococci]|nr:hypothetical protein HK102_004359 [Quaeritorhiza haematococci]
MNFLKVLSRVWLVVINVLIFLLALGVVVTGVVIFKAYGNNVNTSTLKSSEDIQLVDSGDLRIVGIGMMAVGSILAITALAGCCGSLARANAALSFYIGCLVVSLIGILGAGGYSMYKTIEELNAWRSVTKEQWTALSNEAKQIFQIWFTCCGYEYRDNLAYTGNYTIFTNLSNTTGIDVQAENFCNDSTGSFPGCHDGGSLFYLNWVRLIGVGMGLCLLFVLITLPAAIIARRRNNHVVKGAPAAPAYAPANSNEPLIQGGYQKF